MLRLLLRLRHMLHWLLHLRLGRGTHLLLWALHLLRVGGVLRISRGRRPMSRLHLIPLLRVKRSPRIMLHTALLLLQRGLLDWRLIMGHEWTRVVRAAIAIDRRGRRTIPTRPGSGCRAGRLGGSWRVGPRSHLRMGRHLRR